MPRAYEQQKPPLVGKLRDGGGFCHCAFAVLFGSTPGASHPSFTSPKQLHRVSTLRDQWLVLLPDPATFCGQTLQPLCLCVPCFPFCHPARFDHLCSPARLAHLYSAFRPREPTGRKESSEPWKAGWVRSVARSEHQTTQTKNEPMLKKTQKPPACAQTSAS